MREIDDIKYHREKNDMGDFVINGELTIKELYILAKRDGFEDRSLFFSIKGTDGKGYFSTSNVVDFGKGWTKDTAIIHLTYVNENNNDSCG
jgi:hypothetical protein